MASAEEKAEYLVCLATLFSWFSSENGFGTSLDSPYALRMYPIGLLNSACGLSPDKFDNVKIEDWISELKGNNCSAALSTKMHNYANSRKSSQKILASLKPPSW